MREGNDVTIVTLSQMVQKALVAAEELAKEGINAEVVDLRTLVPLDTRRCSARWPRPAACWSPTRTT